MVKAQTIDVMIVLDCNVNARKASKFKSLLAFTEDTCSVDIKTTYMGRAINTKDIVGLLALDMKRKDNLVLSFCGKKVDWKDISDCLTRMSRAGFIYAWY